MFLLRRSRRSPVPENLLRCQRVSQCAPRGSFVQHRLFASPVTERGKQRHRREDSIRSKRRGAPTYVAPVEPIEPVIQELSALTTALEAGEDQAQYFHTHLPEIHREYEVAARSGLLDRRKTADLAKIVHEAYRRYGNPNLPDSKLLEFLDNLRNDYVEGLLPRSPWVGIHMLAIYKESKQYDKGLDLWNWLSVQTDTEDCINATTYGIVIELSAYKGEPLSKQESLFQAALDRFPGDFSEYHISPNAILPDRSQPVQLRGTSMNLLQGMFTARLLHGEWRRAYLDLDTMLRLHPTDVPVQAYLLIMRERPLIEGYRAFHILCRGRPPADRTLNTVLDQINQLQLSVYCPTISYRVQLCHAMVIAIQAYKHAGGKLNAMHLTTLLSGLRDIFPASHQDPLTPEVFNKVQTSVNSIQQAAVLLFAKNGVPPSPTTFNNIVMYAGKSHQPGMIHEILGKMKQQGQTPSDNFYRSWIKSAQNMGDAEEVKLAWKTFVTDMESSGMQLSQKDWMQLASAETHLHELRPFVMQQLEALRHTITHQIKQKVVSLMDEHSRRRPAKRAKTPENVSKEALSNLIKAIAQLSRDLVAAVEGMSGGGLSKEQAASIRTSLMPQKPLASDLVLRPIYDSLTTDPRQPAPEDATVSTKPIASGYTLEELRFQNWKSMTELIADATRVDEQIQRLVNKAVQNGQPMRKDFKSQAQMNVLHQWANHGYTEPEDLRSLILHLRRADTSGSSNNSRADASVETLAPQEAALPLDSDMQASDFDLVQESQDLPFKPTS